MHLLLSLKRTFAKQEQHAKHDLIFEKTCPSLGLKVKHNAYVFLFIFWGSCLCYFFRTLNWQGAFSITYCCSSNKRPHPLRSLAENRTGELPFVRHELNTLSYPHHRIQRSTTLCELSRAKCQYWCCELRCFNSVLCIWTRMWLQTALEPSLPNQIIQCSRSNRKS